MNGTLDLDRSESTDQRVFLRNVSWRHYLDLVRVRGESHSVRMAYLEGELELMSPSMEHESRAEMIGLLLAVWALETETRLDAFGSWTLQGSAKKQGLEPDKCYFVGGRRGRVPDIAI